MRPSALIEVKSWLRWNFTPSPGWSKEEASILRICLLTFGIGRWLQIIDSGLLPGKLIQQLSGQTQRLLGQQSLAGALSGVRFVVYYSGMTASSLSSCIGALDPAPNIFAVV